MASPRCTHPRPHRTGEFTDEGYLGGADTTVPLEGAAAIEFLRQLQMPEKDRPSA